MFVFFFSLAKKNILKKNGPFGGGVSFLEYFHEFLGLGHKKIFGMTLGQSRCFEKFIGQFRPLPAIL